MNNIFPDCCVASAFSAGAQGVAGPYEAPPEGFPDKELQTIFGHTPFLLAHCSSELRYRFVSDGYAQMFGRAPEDFSGKPLVEIMGVEG
jgi:hypothetical protein